MLIAAEFESSLAAPGPTLVEMKPRGAAFQRQE
jgi:hypothetical protein